ncbi:cadherin-like domain-containing protein [Geminocystis sp. NIES-3709]|uniref:cadherin-like domain-containing protein n=1 Tax=Geminocystis sp. NIES-3709 TaxID=1617448 RepID=UPI0005FCD7A1|nr:cadherin-like domain-containing protein [Geminocystis sp. NIES-3709]BAQ66780.1 alkaline phosphatase [Geminocystis sp. NIES-3709]
MDTQSSQYTLSPIFNNEAISSDSAEFLTPIQSLIQDQLLNWFSKEDYLISLAIPFSANLSTTTWTENAQTLQQSILNGSYNIRLEIRSSSELEGALGAYSATGTTGQRTIYLNNDWLQTASIEEIQAVLLEELGHDFDNFINNGADSQGDEGEIFGNLVLNTDANTSGLLQQNDHNIVTIDGQQVAIEAAFPTNIGVAQTFIMPFKESDVRTSLYAINTAVGTTLKTIISTAITSNGTIIVYDHWEDGYEADINNPIQSTTQVWGDGDSSNGQAPGAADDILRAGQVIVLNNDVVLSSVGSLTANAGKPYWDGRDKIGATKALTVTKAGWALSPGTVLAGAVNVFDIENSGSTYTIPIGQNTITNIANPNDTANRLFEYTSLHIVASANNTRVKIDKDGNGTVDLTVTLNQGDTYLVSGGVLQGATVTAEDALGTTTKKPIMVYSIAGDVGSAYENRWLAISPKEQWSNSYFAPVSTTLAADPTHVFLYNPSTTSSIRVYYDTQTTIGSFIDIAANSTNYVPMGSSAAHFYTKPATVGAQAPVFFAVSTIDSDGTNNATRDWSYNLIPETYLTTRFAVAWAPGNSNADPLTAINGSPVWVTAPSATTLYIDLDGNGWLNSSSVDGTGLNPDYTKSNSRNLIVPISKLQSYRIFDTLDNNQSGINVFTLDGTLITAAWGEDPSIAGPGNPFLDMGTTVIPYPDYVLNKTSQEAAKVLAPINNEDGLVQLNEQIQYTITVTNRAVIELLNTNITDEFTPSDSAVYVPNSATLTIYRPDGSIYLQKADLDNETGGLFPFGDWKDVGGNIGNQDGILDGYTLVDSDPNTPGVQGLPRGYQAVYTYRATVRNDVNKALADADLTVTNSVTLKGDQTDPKKKDEETVISVPNVDGLVEFTSTSNGTATTGYQEGGTIFIRVTDNDINTYRDLKTGSDTTPDVADMFTVIVTNTTTGEQETVTLTETGVGTGVFVGQVATSINSSDNGNNTNTLYMVGGDGLKVEYIDPIFGGVFDNPLSPGIPNGDDNDITTGNANTANATVSVPTQNKVLYLSDDGNSGDTTGDLDRISPVQVTPQDTNTQTTTSITPSVPGTGGGVGTYLDNFSTAAYNNSNGTETWSTSWTESGTNSDTNATSGIIQINTSAPAGLVFERIGSTNPLNADVQRSLNLSAADTSQAITLSFTVTSVDSLDGTGENVTLKISTNGGSSFNAITGGTFTKTSGSGTTITHANGVFTGDADGAGTYTVDIKNLIASATDKNNIIIQFDGTNLSRTNANDPLFAVDTFQVSFTKTGTPATPAVPATFTQAIPMATDFVLPAGTNTSVTTYITHTSGVFVNGSYNITANLKESGTSWGTNTTATYTAINATTGTLTWSISSGSGVTLDKGNTVSLEITSTSGVPSFQIDYDSNTKPSQINFPTSTVIKIVDVDGIDLNSDGDITDASEGDNGNGTQLIGFFDSGFTNDLNNNNNGNLITVANAGQTVYVRIKVKDPFGDYDITKLDLTIDAPGGTFGDIGVGTPLTLTNTYVVDTNDNTPAGPTDPYKIYEYVWNTVLNTGNYTINVKAHEGYEGTVFDTASTTFRVDATDTGTPSVTQFITALNGADAGLTYAVNANAFLRITDLDENTNGGSQQTITAVVNGITFTLTETGNNTGVFEVQLSPNFSNLTAGTVLSANYVDSNDPTDVSSDTIYVPSPNLPPSLDLDTTSTSTVNNTAVFNEGDSAVSFVKDATTTLKPVADDANTIASLTISIPTTQITTNGNGASEQLVITGATQGGTIALNFTNTTSQSLTSVILGGVTYTVSSIVTGGNQVLTFSVPGGSSTSIANAEALLEALKYQNISPNPTGVDPNNRDRVFTLVVNDGAFNSNQATFSVDVNAIDFPPVIDLDNTVATGTGTLDNSATFTENGSAVYFAKDANVSGSNNSGTNLSDVDSDNLTKLTISIDNTTLQTGDQVRIGTTDINSIGSGTVTIGLKTFAYTVADVGNTRTYTFSNTGTKAEYEALLDQLNFNSTSENPSGSRGFAVTVTDDSTTAQTSNPANFTVNIVPVNDPPTLDLDPSTALSGTFPNYGTTDDNSVVFTENGAAVAFTASGISIADVDGDAIASLTISFTTSQISDGTSEKLQIAGGLITGGNVDSLDLNFSGVGTANVSVGGVDYLVTQSVGSGTSTLVFTKVGGGIVTKAEAEILLDALRYNNTSENPTDANRVFNLQVNDGVLNSNTATFTVDVNPVNDPPTLDLDPSTALSGTFPNYGTTDDNSVVFTENGAAVAFTASGISIADVDGDAIASLTISFTTSQISDGTSEKLQIAGGLITGGNVDSLDLNFSGVGTANVSVGGVDYLVTQSVGSGTSTLVFTKVGGGIVTKAEAEILLDALRYNNTSENPTDANRVFNLQVNDGVLNSNTATFTVDVNPVNDPPTLDLDPSTALSGTFPNYGTTDDNSVVFTENGVAVAFTASGISIADVDGDAIASLTISFTTSQISDGTSEKLQIAGGLITGGNVDSLDLNFSGVGTANVSVGGVDYLVTQSVGSGTSTLVFTKVGGGIVTKAEAEILLDALRYNNTSENPTDANRVFNLQVNDGVLNSNTATFTVDVNPVNDPPTLDLDPSTALSGTFPNYGTTDDNSVVFTENGAAVAFTASGISIADVDGDAIASLTISFTTSQISDGTSEKLQIAGGLITGGNVDSLDLNFSGVGTANVSVGGVDYLVTQSVGSGTSTLVFTKVGGGIVTKAEAEILLDALRYNNTSENPTDANRVFNLQVNDGVLNSNTATFTVDVNPVNDPPTLDLDPSTALSGTFPNYGTTDDNSVVFTENGAAVAFTASGISIADVDGDAIASLTISFTTSQISDGTSEKLQIAGGLITGGNVDSLDLNFSGVGTANVSVGGVDYLVTQSVGSGTSTLVFTKVGGGIVTKAEAEILLDALRYNNTSENPTDANRVFNLQVNDGVLNSNTATFTVDVNPVNDPPTLDLDPSTALSGTFPNYGTTDDNSVVFTENGAAVAFTASGISIADVDGDAIASLTISFTTSQISDGTSEKLQIAGGLITGGNVDSLDLNFSGVGTANVSVGGVDYLVTQSVGSGTSTLVFTKVGGGIVTKAEAEILLDALRYNNTSENPTDANRVFNLQVNDGVLNSNTATFTVDVNPVNDAPVNTLPPTYSTNQNTNLTLTSLSVADIDANSGTISVQLSVTSGSLSAVSANGVTVSGSGGSSIALSGTLSDINQFLTNNSPVFTPLTGSTGNVTLTMLTNDNGNTGSGGSLTDTDNSVITIIPTNVNPIANPDTNNVNEDGVLTVNSANGLLSNDTDTDVGNVLSVTTFIVAGDSTVYQADNTGFGNTVTLTKIVGTTTVNIGQLIINTNGSYTFTPSSNFNSTTSLPTVTYNISDGNGGTATSTLILNVNAVNDAPIALGNPTIAPVLQTNTNPVGAMIGTLSDPSYNDSADQVLGGSSSTPLAGIAIVGNTANSADGVWQYAIASTSTVWYNIPTSLSNTSALVLSRNSKIRFKPNTDFMGSPAPLEVHLADTSQSIPLSANASDLKNIGTVGGSSIWSVDTIEISTMVMEVNTAPVINNLEGDTVSILPGPGGTTIIDQGANGSMFDRQGLKSGGIFTVSLGGIGVGVGDTLSFASGVDVSSSTISIGGVNIGSIDPVNNGQDGKPLVITLTKDLDDTEADTLIKNVNFTANSNPGLRSISFNVTDGDTLDSPNLSSNTAIAFVHVGNTVSYDYTIEGDINGQVRSDILKGTNPGQVINGSTVNGNDIIYGKGANDILYGYKGNDLMGGGDNNDTVDASDGNDVLLGSNGDDLLNGGNDNDLLFGGDGSDKLNGGAGNDYMSGGLGRDTLTGGTGADQSDYRNYQDSLLGPSTSQPMYDVIPDFNVTQGDKILTTNIIGSLIKFNQYTQLVMSGTTLTASGITNALNGTAFAQDTAALLRLGTTTKYFLAIDNGGSGFDPAKDSIIEIATSGSTIAVTNIAFDHNIFHSF